MINTIKRMRFYADFEEFIGTEAVYTMTNDDGEDVVVYTLSNTDYDLLGRPERIALTIEPS